ncbi:hypothetical protein BOTBODRAFT_118593 [Botryobasidium botryosum FD-172 SS1]|uniref:Uncharacterized protein n=1 Tax=Botryobasidium botryosum (strain FD-172 SS1) TaxID=930990 RepID=A0A067M172_BOTB1|nr:hypothetical protein BOTBODRAFT_118593 [Botryobasidium botryosum FD-172 SS1]
MYDKMERLEGGNMMHASDVVAIRPGDRDMGWIKSVQMVDHFANHRHRPSYFRQENFYDRVQRVLLFTIHSSPSCQAIYEPTPIVVAVIAPCKVLKKPTRVKFPRYRKPGPFEVVDVVFIEALIGRVWSEEGSRDWYIIEREGILREYSSLINRS